MKKHIAMIAAMLAGLLTIMSPAQAATPLPLAPEAGSSPIEQVRFRHRRCQYHYVPRWGYRAAHRHRGARNWPKRCRRLRRRPNNWRHRNCVKIGPFYICE